jgi:hypothetical protein
MDVCSLTGEDVRLSRRGGLRKIVDIIFAYTDRKTNVTEKYFVRVYAERRGQREGVYHRILQVASSFPKG